MGDLAPKARGLTLRGVLTVLLFIAFDCATILPTAAGCYVIKRAANIDVFRNKDMLPDPLIEDLLARIAQEIRGLL